MSEKKSLGELGHEGNHQVEQTDGLDESETQNGVREKLATESGVAGNTVEEGGEDQTDTDTSTGQTDGGRTHTDVLGDLNHGLGDLGRVHAALGLESLAADGRGQDGGGGLLALEAHASEGALGSSELHPHGRTGDLGGRLGHGVGQARGENTGGGHCI